MRERILSWGDDFTIEDEAGREAFCVDGKVFSFGDKLSFKDGELKKQLFTSDDRVTADRSAPGS